MEAVHKAQIIRFRIFRPGRDKQPLKTQIQRYRHILQASVAARPDCQPGIPRKPGPVGTFIPDRQAHQRLGSDGKAFRPVLIACHLQRNLFPDLHALGCQYIR